MGRLMRLMGFICQESQLYICPPEGAALLTLAAERYRFYCSLTQPPAPMVGEPAFRRTLQSCATLQRPGGFYGSELTFAVAVGASEDGALLNAAERLEEAPHVVF